MLKKYSGIISVLAVVVAVILVIGGIAAAINLESFLPVLYFGIGAAIYYIFMHSYALLLETTANNEDALAAIRQFLQKLDTQAPTKRSATPYVSIATSHVTTLQRHRINQRNPLRLLLLVPVLYVPNAAESSQPTAADVLIVASNLLSRKAATQTLRTHIY